MGLRREGWPRDCSTCELPTRHLMCRPPKFGAALIRWRITSLRYTRGPKPGAFVLAKCGHAGSRAQGAAPTVADWTAQVALLAPPTVLQQPIAAIEELSSASERR